MASPIHSCPFEVLEGIAFFVDDKKDLASLRLTCGNFAAAAAKHLFRRLSFYCHPESLDDLKSVSTQPSLARYVRRLCYDAAIIPCQHSEPRSQSTWHASEWRTWVKSFTDPNLNCGFHLHLPCQAHDDHPVQDECMSSSACEVCWAEARRDVLVSWRMHGVYLRYVAEQEHALRQIPNALAQILQGLTHATKLKFDGRRIDERPPAKTKTDFWLWRSHNASKLCPQAGWRQLSSFLQAASSAQLQYEELTIKGIETESLFEALHAGAHTETFFPPTNAFESPISLSLAPRLRKLTIYIYPEPCEPYEWFTALRSRNAFALSECIASATSLHDLNIFWQTADTDLMTIDDIFPSRVRHGNASANKSLKSVHLRCVYGLDTAWIKFADMFNPTLEDVWLLQCGIFSMPESTWDVGASVCLPPSSPLDLDGRAMCDKYGDSEYAKLGFVWDPELHGGDLAEMIRVCCRTVMAQFGVDRRYGLKYPANVIDESESSGSEEL